MGKSGTAEKSGINTGAYCEHKNTESLFVQGVARYGTNNLFSFSLSTDMTVSSLKCGPRTCTVRALPWLLVYVHVQACSRNASLMNDGLLLLKFLLFAA